MLHSKKDLKFLTAKSRSDIVMKRTKYIMRIDIIEIFMVFKFNYLQRNRSFSSKGKNVSTGNNSRARILQTGLDVINNNKSPGGVDIWGSIFLTPYACAAV